VVAGLIFGLYVFVQPPAPQQLATQYEQAHLQVLGVSMSGNSDPMQTALGVYNDGKTSEALSMFEKIIQTDTSNFTAKQYAGIAALRLKNYDKAIQWFNALDTYTGLHSNPAKFYLALTLMERNQSGDVATAKDLLQQVVQDDGEEREIAQEWLMKMQ
jgi:tetratricopeptide (TPR) repeat protein